MPTNLEKWAFFVFLDFIKLCVYMSSVKGTWEHTKDHLICTLETEYRKLWLWL